MTPQDVLHNGISQYQPSESQQICGGAYPSSWVDSWPEPVENNDNTCNTTFWGNLQDYNDPQNLFVTQFPLSVGIDMTENSTLFNSTITQEGPFGLNDRVDSHIENSYLPFSGIESMEWMLSDTTSNPFNEVLETGNPLGELELISQVDSIELPNTIGSAVPLTGEMSNFRFEQQSSVVAKRTYIGYLRLDQESEAIAKTHFDNTTKRPRRDEEEAEMRITKRKFVLVQTHPIIVLNIPVRALSWDLLVQYPYHLLVEEGERDHYLLMRDRCDKSLGKGALALDVVD